MPYDGLFLPYQEQWQNLGPVNQGLEQYNVTCAKMNNYYESIQGDGFHSLSYCKCRSSLSILHRIKDAAAQSISAIGERRRIRTTPDRAACVASAQTAKTPRAPTHRVETPTCVIFFCPAC